MTVPFNIGVLQLSMEPVHETMAMAKACEHAGFDSILDCGSLSVVA